MVSGRSNRVGFYHVRAIVGGASLVEERAIRRRSPRTACLLSGIDRPAGCVEVMDVAISPGPFQDVFVKDLLGGVIVLEGAAFVLANDWTGPYTAGYLTENGTREIRLVPHYAWGNRGESR